MSPESEGGPKAAPEAATAKRQARSDSTPGGGQDVDRAIAESRRGERAARLVGDDPASRALSHRRYKVAVLDPFLIVAGFQERP